MYSKDGKYPMNIVALLILYKMIVIETLVVYLGRLFTKYIL